MDELQRVDDAFSLEMIVGDDEGGVAGFGDVLDARAAQGASSYFAVKT